MIGRTIPSHLRRVLPMLGLLLLAIGGPLLARLRHDRFDHATHARLFPSCLSCHTGIMQADRADSGASPGIWPAPENCATCHDGVIQKRVSWTPPPLPRTNLRFTHAAHAKAVVERHADSTLACRDCHAEPGANRMAVRLAVTANCLGCHGIAAAHLTTPDTACATCHLPLAQAVRLTNADIGAMPRPPSHDRAAFAAQGHGELAKRGPGPAASCAVCHARNTCIECHVNAPEVPAVQALALDPRVPAHPGRLRAPPTHAASDFLKTHGARSGRRERTCATCHTQESCLTCHIGTPRVAEALPQSAPGRGSGAVTHRQRPSMHGADFSENHGPFASASPRTCAACHARTACLDCHRPNPARPSVAYHPSGFLASHPVQAYQRSSSCTDCHNPGQFCATCHAQAGLAARGPLGAGYHDAKRFFLAGHGQAARQHLESCVSCHTERDCLTCHASSIVGGRNFNPHGPGFDAERLRRRNTQMCTVCHSAAIPGGARR